MAKTPQIFKVKKGQLIPCDGIVVDGLAFVDESAIAGVSKPVLLDSSIGRNEARAGGLIIDGQLKIRVDDDRAILHHTVKVNLDILDGSLAELMPLASSTGDDNEKQAYTLLASAQESSQLARENLDQDCLKQLTDKLGVVFRAMDKSTKARKLLGACTV